jgi:hypothetical protein
MPGLVATNVGEVALAESPLDAVRGTALPTGLPFDGHPDAPLSGPQTKKLTVPVGLPPAPLPVTLAWSVSPAASVVTALVGVDVTEGVA